MLMIILILIFNKIEHVVNFLFLFFINIRFLIFYTH